MVFGCERLTSFCLCRQVDYMCSFLRLSATLPRIFQAQIDKTSTADYMRGPRRVLAMQTRAKTEGHN